MRAVDNAHADCVRALLPHCTPASINRVCEAKLSALHRAAGLGLVYCVVQLVHANAQPQLRDGYGRNALHHACRNGHTLVLLKLI
eukprot:4030186-Pleurochrysis_carterae.AAC.1